MKNLKFLCRNYTKFNIYNNDVFMSMNSENINYIMKHSSICLYTQVLSPGRINEKINFLKYS